MRMKASQKRERPVKTKGLTRPMSKQIALELSFGKFPSANKGLVSHFFNAVSKSNYFYDLAEINRVKWDKETKNAIKYVIRQLKGTLKWAS